MRKKHGLHVELEAGPEAEPVGEDLRVMLFEGVRELLFNIVKHAGTDHATVGLSRLDAKHIRIVVADSGKGFDCSSLDRDAEGGFGLFSIRERLELVGATLRVESSPGRGTHVYITAPTAGEDIPIIDITRRPQWTGDPRAGDRHSLTGCIRVVHAAAHHILREGLAGLLEQQPDIRVIGQASNGLDAIDMARELQPDVLVMDITMPIIDGIEAARRIAVQWPDVKIIGLSMHDDDAVRSNMLTAGATAFLTKGGPVDEVTTAIRRAASIGCKTAANGDGHPAQADGQPAKAARARA
jgi:CheY-like chemotaxis protein